MQLTFASYNIHKAVGLDRRRDPERILAVLREIDADVIALQEADRRFGDRASVLPRQLIDDHTPWRTVPLQMRPDSIGWHGNALLVRRGIEIVHAEPVRLPMLEPRGAVCAKLVAGGRELCVVGMHLDLSGLRRRRQLRAVPRRADGRFQPVVALARRDARGEQRLAGDQPGQQLPQPPADRRARPDRRLGALDLLAGRCPPLRTGGPRIRSSAGLCPAERCLKNRHVPGNRALHCSIGCLAKLLMVLKQ